jgi:nucleotide-binding universal stress UspA family protein
MMDQGSKTVSYRDILAMLASADGEDGVIAAARTLADQAEGRATALLFEIEPDAVYVPDGYRTGEVYAEIAVCAHKDFIDQQARLKARLAREPRPWKARSASIAGSMIAERAGIEARYADIIVMGRPDSALRRRMFEGVLFGAGRPLMIAPRDWTPGPIGKNVVVGWNAKREAARALADARPLIERAEKTTIVTVDARPGLSGHGEAPGADVAAHLARCGLNVELRNVDGMGRNEAAALIDECSALGADLLVAGGYGRARLQEVIFGGVTRDLIRSAPLPVLMAH